MKTCLVTGGAGFIGSHLCDKLIGENLRVVCLDNLSTGRKANIGQLLKGDNFVFVNADAAKESTYRKDLTGHYDYIFHLASPASPNKQSPLSYLAQPVATMLVNSVGTYYLLELAKTEKAKLLFASSSEIYGDPYEHPQKETYWGNVNPIGERSCYDESKRFGETLTKVYEREKGVDARIVRIFNTYGPRMDPGDGRAMVNFVIQAIKRQPFTIYGDGRQTRSFCYVDDLVEGLMRAMFTGAKGQVYNLGNPEEYTMLELVEIIAGCLKIATKVKHSPLPLDDPKKRKPDITKATTELGWQPQISLQIGLKQTIAYFENQLTHRT